MDSVQKIEADARELRLRIFGYLESVGREYGMFDLEDENASFEWFNPEKSDYEEVGKVVWSENTGLTSVVLKGSSSTREMEVDEFDLDGLLVLMQRVAGIVRKNEEAIRETLGGTFPDNLKNYMQETDDVISEAENRIRKMLYAVTDSEGGVFQFPNDRAVAVRLGKENGFGRINGFLIEEGRFLAREISAESPKFLPAETIGYDALVPLLRELPNEKAEKVVVTESEKDLLERLRSKQREADNLRAALGISKANEIIWQADTPEGLVLVQADGFGAARLMEVEGNFPVDFSTVFEKRIGTERRAMEIASEWQEGNYTLEAHLERLESKGERL